MYEWQHRLNTNTYSCSSNFTDSLTRGHASQWTTWICTNLAFSIFDSDFFRASAAAYGIRFFGFYFVNMDIFYFFSGLLQIIVPQPCFDKFFVHHQFSDGIYINSRWFICYINCLYRVTYIIIYYRSCSIF